MWAIRSVAAPLLCVLLAGCQAVQAPADSKTEAATLDGFQEAWEKAFNSGDAAGLVALYADDATVSPPGSPPLRSRSALQDYFTKEIAANQGVVFDINPPNDREISGESAWETGTWTARDKSGKTLDTGKYVTSYRKRDGKWLMAADIWNSDTPPAPPPAAAPAKP